VHHPERKYLGLLISLEEAFMKCHIILGVVSLFGLSLISLGCGTGGASIPPPVDIAYVANAQDHSMSVVNIPADKITSTIEIGNSSSTSFTTTASYPFDVAVTPDGSRAYVTDASTSVWVVETRSNRVIDKIGAGTGPGGIAITPDGKRAYVTTGTCGLLLCSGPGSPAGSLFSAVDVIDTETDSTEATITLGQTGSSGVTISPDGTRAYVAATNGNIWVIDTATNSIIDTISVPATELDGIAANPDGKAVYVIGFVNSQANRTVTNTFFMDVIDTKTDTVTTSITLSNIEEVSSIAVTPDGSHAYVTGRAGDVYVIDTAKNAIGATVPVSGGAELIGIAFTPDGTRAYVTCVGNRLIYVLDTSTNHVVDTVKADAPGGLAITRAR
jgi:YVTN family beta-propeller protein